jgi:hypothetical protein
MDKDRFMSKDLFIKSLPSITTCNIVENSKLVYHQDIPDIHVEDLANVINPQLFPSCLQGFVNIGIDSSLSVKAKFKLLKCVYNSNYEYTIAFPASSEMTIFVKRVLVGCKEIVGEKRYQDWCNNFSTIPVNRGRKRKVSSNRSDTHWLLSEEEEHIYLNTSKRFIVNFDKQYKDIMCMFTNGFSITQTNGIQKQLQTTFSEEFWRGFESDT